MSLLCGCRSTLLEFFAKDKNSAPALETVDWDSWFYKPGLPPKPKFDTSLAEQCYMLAEKWNTKVFLTKMSLFVKAHITNMVSSRISSHIPTTCEDGRVIKW